jgi:hypothetical protein
MAMLFTEEQLSKGTASRQDGITQEDEEAYRAKTNEFVALLVRKLDMCVAAVSVVSPCVLRATSAWAVALDGGRVPSVVSLNPRWSYPPTNHKRHPHRKSPWTLWSACTLTHRFFTYESFKRRDRLVRVACLVYGKDGRTD